jgi:hypothetical protein
MNSTIKATFWWIFAVVFTVTIFGYQRATGPTYPIKSSVTMGENKLNYKLPRSHGGNTDATISINAPDQSIEGKIIYKRYKTKDEYTELPMIREGEQLVGVLPHQPPAGKLEYNISLKKGEQIEKLNDKNVVIRFKGSVPGYILVPHILFMIIAMIFSSRTGIEAIVKGRQTFTYALVTLISLTIGGLILGPLVQYHAFGEFWTGWPNGKDLTDNKTALGVIFWLIAVLVMRKNKGNRLWAIIAALVLLAVYLIPHSMFGSELDPETGQVMTGNRG